MSWPGGGVMGTNDPRYFVGVDLGQAQDFTAMVIAERQGTPQPPDRKRAGTWGRAVGSPAQQATPPQSS